ncbi:MAG: DUF4105 domain-containing protein [Muribaculaceae bacterium]|nr:DUF4105 domain-containing protein [Muribaculaceae bacterium]
MNRIIAILITIFYLSCGVTAQERTDTPFPADSVGGEDLIVSIVTCDPGPDVYELCGHAALRIRNAQMDSVWNYGIFDFTSPNFIYRFCKGETDYMVYGYQFDRFMPAYVRRGSKVTEQVLDLTQEEARRLRALVQVESRPENRVYRYNYVRDNCATRPWKRVTEASVRDIHMPDTLYYPTFRSEMRHFHRNYPWYQFGIDLVLGSGLDYPMAKDEDIFAPPVLSAKIAEATIGGRPLVKETNVIFPGYVDATLPPTPWWRTPMAVGIVMLLLSIGTMFVYLKSGKLWKWWIFLYFFAAGIAGCIVTFLVFCSEHEATSPNVLIYWLNPLQLIVAAGIWFKSWRTPVSAMAAYDFVMAVVLIVLFAAGLTPQKANPAVWPMLLSVIPLAVIVLLNTGALKVTYKEYKK